MRAAHTPGPWETLAHSNGFIDIVTDVQIIEGSNSWHGIATMNESDNVARADATLIAAAPAMFAALQLVRMSAGWQVLSAESRAVIDSAIDAATGSK